jgi:hypothetical protein
MGTLVPESSYPKRKVGYVEEHYTSDYHLHTNMDEDNLIKDIMFYGTIAAITVGGYALYSEYAHQKHVAEHGLVEATKPYLQRFSNAPIHWDPEGQTSLFNFKGRNANAAAQREEGIKALAAQYTSD